jgi:hypothetical protein
MGGSIAVTIREPNGKEHRMCRWTNPLPHIINHPKICAKDPAYLANYLKGWYDFVEDWEQSGHKDEKCKHNMTSCYAPNPYLAPYSYGLVVIDMQKDVILDMNGYTELGTLCDAGVRLELMAPESMGLNPKDEETHCAALKEFARQGKVVGFVQYKKKPLDWRGKPFEYIKDFILKNEEKYGKIVLDMSPFKVERFEESHEGAMKMRERVLELGFKLSKKEEKLWTQWRNEDE